MIHYKLWKGKSPYDDSNRKADLVRAKKKDIMPSHNINIDFVERGTVSS